MRCVSRFWGDEAGFVLSSEMVLVGTVGIVGASVGLAALSEAVNEELEDVAFAIRSLDQSYEIQEVRGCGGWTAGSSFKQETVKESLCDLEKLIDREEAAAKKAKEQAEREDDKKELEMKKPDPKKTPPKKPKPRDKEDEEVVL